MIILNDSPSFSSLKIFMYNWVTSFKFLLFNKTSLFTLKNPSSELMYPSRTSLEGPAEETTPIPYLFMPIQQPTYFLSSKVITSLFL